MKILQLARRIEVRIRAIDQVLAKLQKIKGILEQKPWSKTLESYCAQGSEYWVLKKGQTERKYPTG
jgi:hypothetical protein